MSEELYDEDLQEEIKKLYTELKLKATELFNDKKYKEAIATYEDILALVKEKSVEYIICHNNISQCYINLNDYANALKHANLVIENDETNEKAIKRRKLCYDNLGSRIYSNKSGGGGGGGGDNAQIVHTYHKIKGDGNCFFSSLYACLKNAKLLDNLNRCFESYVPAIVLDTDLTKELQYIKALREMCIKSEEYKKELEGVYKGFFVQGLIDDQAFVMTNNILNGVSIEQLNALGFNKILKPLSQKFKPSSELVTEWGLKWDSNLSYGSLVLIDLLSENKEIATIYYSEPPHNYVDRTFGVLDSKSINTIIKKGNDPNRKKRYMTEIQLLYDINFLLTEKPWATQVEVSFLTKKLKECGKISIDVKHYKISEPQPIVDEHGNQKIYVLNEDEKHYNAYLRNPPDSSHFAKSGGGGGGGGGAEMPSKWNCATCTFINEPGSTVCEMCGTPKPTSNKSIGGIKSNELDSIEEKGGTLHIKFKFGPNTGFEKSTDNHKREIFSKTIGKYIITIRRDGFLFIEVTELIPRVQSILTYSGNSSFGASDTAKIKFTSDFNYTDVVEKTNNFEIIIKESPLFIKSVSIADKEYTSHPNRNSGFLEEFIKMSGGSRRKRKSARKHKSRKTRARRTKSRRHSS